MSGERSKDLLPLSDEEAKVFERRLSLAREKLKEIDAEIERELTEVRERIGSLREKRKATIKMYEAACTMLGIESDPGVSTSESKTSEHDARKVR
jgi:ElaB/YqjD/DUF883 family membrane-anchored ribosome-binding protein